MAGLLLLQGVHGVVEQWKGDDGSLWIHCVHLMVFAGFIIGCCFVRVIKTLTKDEVHWHALRIVGVDSPRLHLLS